MWSRGEESAPTYTNSNFQKLFINNISKFHFFIDSVEK